MPLKELMKALLMGELKMNLKLFLSAVKQETDDVPEPFICYLHELMTLLIAH